jgi:hypothetical protein
MNVPTHYYGHERSERAREENEMLNYYLAEQVAKDRLNEAREMANQARLLATARSAPEPLRVALGLALIRVGRSLAGQSAKGVTRPRRATV